MVSPLWSEMGRNGCSGKWVFRQMGIWANEFEQIGIWQVGMGQMSSDKCVRANEIRATEDYHNYGNTYVT